MPPKKGQRQARGLARQDQILRAAFELFATNGYRSTTIAMIAEQVGISDAGLLHHFPTKEVLLKAVLDARSHPDPDAEWFAAEPGGGLESLQRLPVMAQVLVHQPLLMRFDAVVGGEAVSEGGVVQEHFRHRLEMVRAGLGLMIEVGVQRGEFRADVDPASVAEQITAFMSGIQTQWLLDPDSVDLSRAYENYVAILEVYLRPA